MQRVEPASWCPVGLDDLEPVAWSALRHERSSSVVAGPGAGKTEFLAQRAAYLLQTGICAEPQNILAISFKREAALNLDARVRARCGPEHAARFVSQTFDSFTKGIVDRFWRALPERWRPRPPYEVVSFKTYEVERFLEKTRREAPLHFRADLNRLSGTSFEAHCVGSLRLPVQRRAFQSGVEYAIQRWWKTRLEQNGGSRLTFVLINRLAELVLRANPNISRALQLTYPFVFVDEFQDTTYGQYDFLTSVFQHAGVVVTAVGDDKQRIMGWAGAKPACFSSFDSDFAAQRFTLRMNYRSSPALVQIQHVIAQALDANTEPTVSRAAPALSQDVAQTWVIESQEVESRQLARWMAADMAARGTKPRDYAIIVRQKPDQFEVPLTEELRVCGIGLRNESKQIGRTTLQDLLAEELTSLALALLELATKRQAPSAWAILSPAMQRLRSADPEDHARCRAVEDELTEFVSSLAQDIQATPVSPDAARELVGKVLAFLDLPSLARAYPVYTRGDSLAIAAEAFALHWEACALATPSWADVLIAFAGPDLVPLMTVHKSKGLEYDTVLFLGLDDNLWWSYRAGDKDGLATFFVALSRAKQRVIFTYCPARGSREKVSDLYALLVSAGVPERTIGERISVQSAG